MASKGKGAEEREPQNSEEVVQMYQQARTPLKIRIGIGRLEPGIVGFFLGRLHLADDAGAECDLDEDQRARQREA
jgi:hypothetical protein